MNNSIYPICIVCLIMFFFLILLGAIQQPGYVVYRCGMYSYTTISDRRFNTHEEAKQEMIKNLDETLKWKKVNP